MTAMPNGRSMSCPERSQASGLLPLAYTDTGRTALLESQIHGHVMQSTSPRAVLPGE